MKIKLLCLLILLSSLFGYLEWSGGNRMFILQMEWKFFGMLTTSPKELSHPFIVLPFLGQILLLVSCFLKTPQFRLIWVGLASLSLIMLMIFLIGVMSFNWKMLLSTLPYFVLALTLIRAMRKLRRSPDNR